MIAAPDPADQDRPDADRLHPSGVSERAEPGRRVQGQGDERGDRQHREQAMTARDVGPEQEEGQEDPGRQGEDLGGQHETDRLDRQPGRPGQPPRVTEQLRGRGRVDRRARGLSRPGTARRRPASSTVARSGQPTSTTSPAASSIRTMTAGTLLTPAARPPASGPRSCRTPRPPTRSICSGSGEYSSSIEIASSSIPSPLIASR